MVASIIQVAWAIFTLCGMFTIERWGRRPTLMVGTVICTIGSVVVLILDWNVWFLMLCRMIGFTISISIGTNAAGWAGMVMLIIFFFGFAFGMLPMSWLYPSEILPLHMRHVGLGVAGITTWIFTFLTVFTGPISFKATGYKIFILYIIFNALAFPYGEFAIQVHAQASPG
jgi:MFS family permease